MKSKKTPVYLYDLENTILQYRGRKEFFKKKGIEWTEQQYGEIEATKIYAQAIVEGLRDGAITVVVLPTARESLKCNQEKGILNIVYSAGMNKEIEAALNASNLLPYIDSWVSTFDLNLTKYKTENNFLLLYKKLLQKGKEIQAYFDDDEINLLATKNAAKQILNESGKKINIYLINPSGTMKSYINKTTENK
ncbi:MAG: hypothetical protein WC595_00720 [Candidatus Nanoarchaeia archaeon]